MSKEVFAEADSSHDSEHIEINTEIEPQVELVLQRSSTSSIDEDDTFQESPENAEINTEPCPQVKLFKRAAVLEDTEEKTRPKKSKKAKWDFQENTSSSKVYFLRKRNPQHSVEKFGYNPNFSMSLCTGSALEEAAGNTKSKENIQPTSDEETSPAVEDPVVAKYGNIPRCVLEKLGYLKQFETSAEPVSVPTRCDATISEADSNMASGPSTSFEESSGTGTAMEENNPISD